MVLEADCGQKMYHIMERHPLDLILLDLTLPDGDGLDFIVDVRKKTSIPIIIASGDDEVDRKVKAFELGADDYVLKPFEGNELLARVKANLKRYNELINKKNDEGNSLPKTISIDGWTLDHSKFDIFNAQKTAGNLTSLEFKLLSTLVNKAGKVLKRDELCKALCVENYIPTPRAIDIKITRIRKKMGDSATQPNIIKTVRGVGYMLNQDVLH